MKKTLIIIPVILLSLSSGIAQHNHGGHDHGGGNSHTKTTERGPHGGEIKDVGKYKIEVFVDLYLANDQLTLYVFKRNMKPISETDLKGSITVVYTDGTREKSNLDLRPNNYLTGQLGKNNGFHCVTELFIDEKKVKFEFHNKGL